MAVAHFAFKLLGKKGLVTHHQFGDRLRFDFWVGWVYFEHFIKLHKIYYVKVRFLDSVTKTFIHSFVFIAELESHARVIPEHATEIFLADVLANVVHLPLLDLAMTMIVVDFTNNGHITPLLVKLALKPLNLVFISIFELCKTFFFVFIQLVLAKLL